MYKEEIENISLNFTFPIDFCHDLIESKEKFSRSQGYDATPEMILMIGFYLWREIRKDMKELTNSINDEEVSSGKKHVKDDTSDKLSELKKNLNNHPPKDFDECEEVLKELLRCTDDYNPSREDEINKIANNSLMHFIKYYQE